MRRVLLFALLCSCSFAWSQVLKGIVQDEKGVKLTGVQIEHMNKTNQHDYVTNESNGTFNFQLNDKYRFSKAGYYPTTFTLTSGEYYEDTTLYQAPVSIVLERYKGERHMVLDEFGHPLADVKINIDNKKVIYSDDNGAFNTPPKLLSSTIFKFTKSGYFEEERTFKELSNNKKLILHTISSDKIKITGKARYANGQPISNTAMYLFAGNRLDKHDQHTVKIGNTGSNGEINITHTLKKGSKIKKIGILVVDGNSELMAQSTIDLNKNQQRVELVIQKGSSNPQPSTTQKTSTNDVKKEVANSEPLPNGKTDPFSTADISMSDSDTIEIQEVKTTDTVEIVVGAHLDTLKATNREEVANIDDYVSYLEILLEQNDVNFQQNKGTREKVGAIQEEVKVELTDLKEDVAEKEVVVKQQEEQANLLWLIIGGIILILIPVIILIVSYINHRKTKRINIALQHTNLLLSEAYDRIRSNVAYAEKIQSSILVDPNVIKKNFQDAFVYYQPRDIVSGDFYWFTSFDDLTIIAAVDCTGHGVPGAFMTIMANSFLNEIVNVRKNTDPSSILFQLHEKITSGLRQGDEQLNDGMDLSMICIDKKNGIIRFAGANNPLFYISKGEIHEIKGAKRGVGGQARAHHRKKRKEIPFENYDLKYEEAEAIYLFSDGYADQFGGHYEDKLMKSELRAMLCRHHKSSFNEQETALSTTMKEWRGKLPQTDDQLIIGIQL